MTLLIAAPCSSSGKTLVSLLVAAVAAERGEGLQSFKVGPDYLDPQLLSRVSGVRCRNLDLLLCGEQWVRRSFRWWSQQQPLSLVEGVMGLFDGVGPAPMAAALRWPAALACRFYWWWKPAARPHLWRPWGGAFAITTPT